MYENRNERTSNSKFRKKSSGKLFQGGWSRFWDAFPPMYLRVRPLASRPNIKDHSVQDLRKIATSGPQIPGSGKRVRANFSKGAGHDSGTRSHDSGMRSADRSSQEGGFTLGREASGRTLRYIGRDASQNCDRPPWKSLPELFFLNLEFEVR